MKQVVHLNSVQRGGGRAENQQQMAATINVVANDSVDGDCIIVEMGRAQVYIEQSEGRPRVILHVDEHDPAAALDLVPGAVVEVSPFMRVRQARL